MFDEIESETRGKFDGNDLTYAAGDLPEDTRLEIENALKRNNKILAIKIYREFSGKGLADAKSYIENLHS